MGLVTNYPVFWVSDHIKLKSVWSAAATSWDFLGITVDCSHMYVKSKNAILAESNFDDKEAQETSSVMFVLHTVRNCYTTVAT